MRVKSGMQCGWIGPDWVGRNIGLEAKARLLMCVLDLTVSHSRQRGQRIENRKLVFSNLDAVTQITIFGLIQASASTQVSQSPEQVKSRSVAAWSPPCSHSSFSGFNTVHMRSGIGHCAPVALKLEGNGAAASFEKARCAVEPHRKASLSLIVHRDLGWSMERNVIWILIRVLQLCDTDDGESTFIGRTLIRRQSDGEVLIHRHLSRGAFHCQRHLARVLVLS